MTCDVEPIGDGPAEPSARPGNLRVSRWVQHALLLVSVLPVPALGQDGRVLFPGELPPPLLHVERPELGNGQQWVLLIHESGGFTGGQRTVTIDSTGAIRCSGLESTGCPQRIPPGALDRVDTAIAAIGGASWSGSLAPCSDCVTRLVVLVRRDPDAGGTAEHIAYWNLAPPRPAAAAGQIHSLVRDLLF